ncbi:MAG: lipoyl(octanoyl) transferase LipB [Pseudomonadota bacterium]
MAVEWIIAKAPVPYAAALEAMEARVAAIIKGAASEAVWLLEHPPLYTAGTGARPGDLLDPRRFPVFQAGRGGQYTYHGPGQRIAYVMLDLKRRGRDIHALVHNLEELAIQTLARFSVAGERRAERVGVWVARPDGGEDKIAAIGVRLRRWVSFHGLSINVSPDLSHFSGIVPCGITTHGVTSLAALGRCPAMADVDAALMASFNRIFPEPVFTQA